MLVNATISLRIRICREDDLLEYGSTQQFPSRSG